MKKIIGLSFLVIAILVTSCNAQPGKNNEGEKQTKNEKVEVGTVVHLTKETFQKNVFNYQVNKEWRYEGNKPAIIDFYADWCAPCRMVSPIVEELAKEYSGKIVVYKVDTEKERELAQNLGIQSLPTLLFVPLNGQPQAALGALPKEELVKAINDVLLVK